MAKHELWELQSMQASPLNVKVALTKQRIRDWVHEYGQDGVYVSFSGGKDSTVLLHLVREMYGDSIPAVYCNTGLEYPEITQFVKTFDNVAIIKPKMNFFQVCEKYGFPLISKEVSECVSGARKYLKNVLTSMPENESALTDRQTDRQSQKWHYQKYRQLCGSGEYSKEFKGGVDRKYRKLRGIGEFNSPISGRKSTESANLASNPVLQNRGGGTARDFANLTGIRTSTPRSVDPRLWKGYRQFADTTSDGDKQSTGQSDDGEYP